jgi:hypothetical protein
MLYLVKSGVLPAVIGKTAVLWDVTPCDILGRGGPEMSEFFKTCIVRFKVSMAVYFHSVFLCGLWQVFSKVLDYCLHLMSKKGGRTFVRNADTHLSDNIVL